jgi:hypothetical protein
MKKLLSFSLVLIYLSISSSLGVSKEIQKPNPIVNLKTTGASWEVVNSTSSGTIISVTVDVIYSNQISWSNIGAGQTGSSQFTGIRPEGAVICVHCNQSGGSIKIWSGSTLVACFNITSTYGAICLDAVPIHSFNTIEWVESSC